VKPVRLILHTAACWLMLEVRECHSPVAATGQWRVPHDPAAIAEDRGRIKETMNRIRLAFASNCPDAALFRGLVGTLVLRPG
jgi:hypothetical protein